MVFQWRVVPLLKKNQLLHQDHKRGKEKVSMVFVHFKAIVENFTSDNNTKKKKKGSACESSFLYVD